MIKLVAFDWNGTLLDDIDGGTMAESATRLHFGFKETNIEEIRDHFIIPIKQYWVNAGLSPEFFDSRAEEIEAVYMQHYEPEEAKVNLRDGAKDALTWLNNNSIESIIFSNHIVSHIEIQNERLGIKHLINQILARSTKNDITHTTKTFKDELLKDFVNSKSLNPSEVMVVGDTIEEIEIGQKFGYKAVAITGGWQSKKRLKAAAPDYIIHNLIELKNI